MCEKENNNDGNNHIFDNLRVTSINSPIELFLIANNWIFLEDSFRRNFNYKKNRGYTDEKIKLTIYYIFTK